MRLKEKIEIRQFENYWEKYGREDLFTWTHRYLRLHSELLKDKIYQNMYDYHRNTLIAYLRKDLKGTLISDTELGDLIDLFADLFNKDYPKMVNKYKFLVENAYMLFKKFPEIVNKIHI